jgi:hypothetical protein
MSIEIIKEQFAQYRRTITCDEYDKEARFVIQPLYDKNKLQKVSFTEKEFIIDNSFYSEYIDQLKEYISSIYEDIKVAFLNDENITEFKYSIYLAPINENGNTTFYIVKSIIEKETTLTELDYNMTLYLFVYLFKCYNKVKFIPCYPITTDIEKLLEEIISRKSNNLSTSKEFLITTNHIEKLPSFVEPNISYWFNEGFIISPFDSIDFDIITC